MQVAEDRAEEEREGAGKAIHPRLRKGKTRTHIDQRNLIKAQHLATFLTMHQEILPTLFKVMIVPTQKNPAFPDLIIIKSWLMIKTYNQ